MKRSKTNMKRFLIGFSLLLGVMMQSRQACAQYVLKQANEQYNLFNYSKAVDLYLQAYKKTPTFNVAKHLANSYRLIQDYKNAEIWYAKIIVMPDAKAGVFL